jgi:hypothetical protein
MVSYDSLEEACNANFISISVSGDCTICTEPFSSTDMPIQHNGSNGCSHVFGESCLTAWLDTLVADGQTPVNCPYCRQYWFDLNYVEVESDDEDILDWIAIIGDNIPEAADDPDDADYSEDDIPLIERTTSFEHVRDRDASNILVEMLYTELLRCNNNAIDRVLRARVERAILDADIPSSLPMTDATWKKIERTIRRMLRDSKNTEWDDDTEHKWVRRMARVLPWKFRR